MKHPIKFPGGCLAVALIAETFVKGVRMKRERNKTGRWHFYWTFKGREFEFYAPRRSRLPYYRNLLYVGWIRERKMVAIDYETHAEKVAFLDPAFPDSERAVFFHPALGAPYGATNLTAEERADIIRDIGGEKRYQAIKLERTHERLARAGLEAQAQAIVQHYLSCAKAAMDLRDLLRVIDSARTSEAHLEMIALIVGKIQEGHAKDLGIKLEWLTCEEADRDNYHQFNHQD